MKNQQKPRSKVFLSCKFIPYNFLNLNVSGHFKGEFPYNHHHLYVILDAVTVICPSLPLSNVCNLCLLRRWNFWSKRVNSHLGSELRQKLLLRVCHKLEMMLLWAFCGWRGSKKMESYSCHTSGHMTNALLKIIREIRMLVSNVATPMYIALVFLRYVWSPHFLVFKFCSVYLWMVKNNGK